MLKGGRPADPPQKYKESPFKTVPPKVAVRRARVCMRVRACACARPLAGSNACLCTRDALMHPCNSLETSTQT